MCSKKCFSKKEAQSALNFNRKKSAKGRHHQYRKECRYYQCPDCNAFHLTSKA